MCSSLDPTDLEAQPPRPSTRLLTRAHDLTPGEVHVWWVDLDAVDEANCAFWAVLSPDERERIARLRFPADRIRVAHARGALRQVLARYLDLEPAALQFAYGRRGKPALASDAASVRFNVSHADGRAVVAVARGADVGVDLERIRPDADHELIAERFFSPAERAALKALPAAQRCQAFFVCWTRKEAFVKADGDGLGIPLHAFDVMAPGADRPILVRHEGAPTGADWDLLDLDGGAGFAAALAVKGRCAAVRSFRFAPNPAAVAPSQPRRDARTSRRRGWTGAGAP